MKVNRFLLIAIVFVFALSADLFAKSTISGKITDSKTGENLVGAAVILNKVGSSGQMGAITKKDGSYQITVLQEGDYQLTVKYIGYKNYNKSIKIANNEDQTMDLQLLQDVIGLDEVVVTGVASRNAKAISDVSVARIDAAELTEQQNYTDLNQMVTGKIPGVQAQVSSGNVGGGTKFVVRGGGGLNGAGQPVIFIDGIRITNSEIGGNGTTSGIDIAGQGFSTLADLNPDDIESIEILKGPAGAALYGTSGSNGVVLITTKKGSRSQDSYQVNLKYMTGWNEVHTEYSEDNAYDPATANNIFSDGGIGEMGVNIQGRSGSMNYYFGYTGRDEVGILRQNDLNRNSFRGNFSVTPNDEFRIDVTSNYVMTEGSRPINDNNITGWLGNVLLLNPSYLFTDSAAISAISNQVDNSRFFGSLSLNYAPKWAPGLNAHIDLGMDAMEFDNQQVYSPDFVYNGVSTSGQKEAYRRNQTNFNMNFDIGYQWSAGDGLNFNTVVGSQLFAFQQQHNYVVVEDFPSSDLVNLLSGLTYVTSDDWRREFREAGIFIRQDFNWNEQIYVTGAFRRDYASVLGTNSKSIYYPRLTAALRLDKMMDLGDINFLKVRGGFGQSGQLPGFLSADPLRWGPINAGPGVGAAITSIGNADIEPERISEIELGFEMEYDNSYGVDFTYYMQTANNSIVNKPNPPSSGLTVSSTPVNVGEIKSSGFESMFYASPIKTSEFELDLRFILNYQTNEIVSLGGGEPITTYDIIRWEEGYERSSYIGTKVIGASFDADGNYVGPELATDADGNVSNEYIGSPLPDFTGSFNVGMRIMKNFYLNTLFDFAQDVHVLNYTRRFQVQFGTDVEYNELNESFAGMTPGSEEYNATAEKIAKLNPSIISNFVEEASWVKLREISLRVDLNPYVDMFWGDNMFRSLNLIASVRNVATFTGYRGPDPEVNQTGTRTQVSRGIDFLTLQTPRTFNFTLNVGL